MSLIFCNLDNRTMSSLKKTIANHYFNFFLTSDSSSSSPTLVKLICSCQAGVFCIALSLKKKKTKKKHSLCRLDKDRRLQLVFYVSACLSIYVCICFCCRGFHVGFNSLCAHASVNHLHFHTWYSQYPSYLESAVSCPCAFVIYDTHTLKIASRGIS